jgi:hypothetical protein
LFPLRKHGGSGDKCMARELFSGEIKARKLQANLSLSA